MRLITMTEIPGIRDSIGQLTSFRKHITGSVSTALLYTIISPLSFYLALGLPTYLTGHSPETRMIGALWAMITAIIVAQDTRAATENTAWLEVIGGLIGALAGGIYFVFFPFSILGMGILIGIVVFICEILRVPTYIRFAAFTVAIVMVISALNPDIPPFFNAAHRVLEVIIGCAVAVVFVRIWQRIFPIS